MKCDVCSGDVILKKVPYHYKGQVFLGFFEAEICEKCDLTFFTDEAFKEIEKEAKKQRLSVEELAPTKQDSK